MSISCEKSGEGDAETTTTLVGELSDQASLAGVLNTLYELHRSLLLVERLTVGETRQTELYTQDTE